MPGFTQPGRDPPLRPQTGTCGSARRPVPFDPNRALYHFRWFWDYSGGQTTNLLAHELDIVQWMTGAMPPRGSPHSGSGASLKGFGETPDVFEAIFEYPGLPADLVELRDVRRPVATGSRSAARRAR